VSPTCFSRGGALFLTAALVVACAADAGEDPKSGFGGDSGSVDFDSTSGAPVDSGETPDLGSEASRPPTAPTLCGAECVDTTNNAASCGGCGPANACTGSATCSGGHCANADAGIPANVDSSPDRQPAEAMADAPGQDATAADARATDASARESGGGAGSDSAADSAAPCPQCDGCCDRGGNCGDGTSDTACGATGVYCVSCKTSGLTCQTGGICM
jgi:hypothetical protein